MKIWTVRVPISHSHARCRPAKAMYRKVTRSIREESRYPNATNATAPRNVRFAENHDWGQPKPLLRNQCRLFVDSQLGLPELHCSTNTFVRDMLQLELLVFLAPGMEINPTDPALNLIKAYIVETFKARSLDTRHAVVGN